MPGGVKLGLACKLFRNSGVTYGSPTWVEVKIVKDVTIPLEDEEADATTRGALGWEQIEPAIRKSGLEFQIVWDSADTNVQAILTAYLNRTKLDLAALDGAASGEGAQGLRAVMKVTKFARNEPLNGVVVIDVTIKPCFEITNPPVWATMA